MQTAVGQTRQEALRYAEEQTRPEVHDHMKKRKKTWPGFSLRTEMKIKREQESQLTKQRGKCDI
jgi:hypothetical protein